MGTEAPTHSGGGFACLGLHKLRARKGEGSGPRESGSGLGWPGRRSRSGQGDRWMQMWTLTLSREGPMGGCGRLEPGLRSKATPSPLEGHGPSPSQQEADSAPLPQTKDSGTRRAGGRAATPPTGLCHWNFAVPHPREGSVGLDRGLGDTAGPPSQKQKSPRPGRCGAGGGVTWHSALTLDRRWHRLWSSMTSMVSRTAWPKLAAAPYPSLSSCHVSLLGAADGTLGAMHSPCCPPARAPPGRWEAGNPTPFCCCSGLFQPLAYF